jgi:hypothetical protein
VNANVFSQLLLPIGMCCGTHILFGLLCFLAGRGYRVRLQRSGP